MSREPYSRNNANYQSQLAVTRDQNNQSKCEEKLRNVYWVSSTIYIVHVIHDNNYHV